MSGKNAGITIVLHNMFVLNLCHYRAYNNICYVHGIIAATVHFIDNVILICRAMCSQSLSFSFLEAVIINYCQQEKAMIIIVI